MSSGSLADTRSEILWQETTLSLEISCYNYVYLTKSMGAHKNLFVVYFYIEICSLEVKINGLVTVFCLFFWYICTTTHIALKLLHVSKV